MILKFNKFRNNKFFKIILEFNIKNLKYLEIN